MTRTINEIIVHCTATRPDFMRGSPSALKVDEVRRWHMDDRGWSDIGYHYLIDRDGTVIIGRPIEKQGAHVRGHNASSVGISLFGGHGSTQNDAFLENFTMEQNFALRELILELKQGFPTITKVSGHNEYANKACPGFNVGTYLNQKVELTPPASEGEGSGILDSNTIKASGAAAVATGISAVGGLNPIVQGMLVAGVLLALGYIIWSRRKKQLRGIL